MLTPALVRVRVERHLAALSSGTTGARSQSCMQRHSWCRLRVLSKHSCSRPCVQRQVLRMRRKSVDRKPQLFPSVWLGQLDLSWLSIALAAIWLQHSQLTYEARGGQKPKPLQCPNRLLVILVFTCSAKVLVTEMRCLYFLTVAVLRSASLNARERSVCTRLCK